MNFIANLYDFGNNENDLCYREIPKIKILNIIFDYSVPFRCLFRYVRVFRECTKCHGIFLSTVKYRFLGVRKNAMPISLI
jgi:hypothetical protein